MTRRGWFVLGLAACASSTPETKPTCDLAEVDEICKRGHVRVVGDVEGQAVDLSASADWGFDYPPAWSVEVGENVHVSLWNGSREYEPRPATGMFKLAANGPLYCATAPSCAGADLHLGRARLRSLARLGTCPGPQPVPGEIKGCVGMLGAGCIITGGSLPPEGKEATQRGIVFLRGRTALRADFADGGVFDFDTQRGGTVLIDGDFYCVGDFTTDRSNPERVGFTLRSLSRFARCEDAPGVSGSLRICASLQ